LHECSSEVLCAKSTSEIIRVSVLVKYFVRVFQRSAFCKWSSEVFCASVLVKYFLCEYFVRVDSVVVIGA
jgi:hypothetical protein